MGDRALQMEKLKIHSARSRELALYSTVPGSPWWRMPAVHSYSFPLCLPVGRREFPVLLTLGLLTPVVWLGQWMWAGSVWTDVSEVLARFALASIVPEFHQKFRILSWFQNEETGGTNFSSVQSLSHVWLFVTPWIPARQASLSITNSRSSPKLTSIESVIPSSHLILCRPLLLLPPITPSIRVFSNESTLHMRWPKYWSFSFSISPYNEYSGLISFRKN